MRTFIGLVFLFIAMNSWSEQWSATPTTQGYMKAIRFLPLFVGPGRGYGGMADSLKPNEVTYSLGVSLQGQWTKVLTVRGEEGWVHSEYLVKFEGVPENVDDFESMFAARRAIGTWFSFQFGPSWGNNPFDFRVQVDTIFNLTPNGAIDQFYDQVEIGLGGSYHPFAPPFGEDRAFFQWLYRFGRKKNSMLGPRIGTGFTQLADFKAKRTWFFISGLTYRHYMNEVIGIYAEATYYLRTTRLYGNASAGLTLRF